MFNYEFEAVNKMTKAEYIEFLVSVKGWTRADAEKYADLFED